MISRSVHQQQSHWFVFVTQTSLSQLMFTAINTVFGCAANSFFSCPQSIASSQIISTALSKSLSVIMLNRKTRPRSDLTAIIEAREERKKQTQFSAIVTRDEPKKKKKKKKRSRDTSKKKRENDAVDRNSLQSSPHTKQHQHCMNAITAQLLDREKKKQKSDGSIEHTSQSRRSGKQTKPKPKRWDLKPPPNHSENSAGDPTVEAGDRKPPAESSGYPTGAAGDRKPSPDSSSKILQVIQKQFPSLIFHAMIIFLILITPCRRSMLRQIAAQSHRPIIQRILMVIPLLRKIVWHLCMVLHLHSKRVGSHHQILQIL